MVVGLVLLLADDEDGGRDGARQTVRWLAAFSALAAAGPYEVDYSFYRPIREYIAGFGVMTASIVA